MLDSAEIRVDGRGAELADTYYLRDGELKAEEQLMRI